MTTTILEDQHQTLSKERFQMNKAVKFIILIKKWLDLIPATLKMKIFLELIKKQRESIRRRKKWKHNLNSKQTLSFSNIWGEFLLPLIRVNGNKIHHKKLVWKKLKKPEKARSKILDFQRTIMRKWVQALK